MLAGYRGVQPDRCRLPPVCAGAPLAGSGPTQLQVLERGRGGSMVELRGPGCRCGYHQHRNVASVDHGLNNFAERSSYHSRSAAASADECGPDAFDFG